MFLCERETNIVWLLCAILSVAKNHLAESSTIQVRHKILGKAATFLVYLVIGGVIPAMISFSPLHHNDDRLLYLIFHSICEKLLPDFMEKKGW